ncbi:MULTISPECIES: GyrI-like domain-containing protein [Pseudonocardia]|uniref:Bacterial transcription activator, effector binding domain n=2 Tax=Pseudonocardia TaxID=1847 RepID=A0A1Y2MX96_PSEAH|nr:MULTISPECIES: GyrI-like domain-containing protein [Pseudonocardia]OSY39447.1 Bacterial transcription activator, effector binding domain [Pseudonocardia autotrophica]TDN75315.1 effector-binding domain-containing protein [Pseudonocardia autotrophica]BBF99261.1 transcriptional regulator [Pseudonocardia autotrophica]GEC24807.1 transcriptional regulator [Pseudonocardia saturnea]
MTTAGEPQLITTEPAVTAVVRGVVSADELPTFYDRAFGVLPATVAAQGITAAGPAFGLYHGLPGATFDLEVGFPTDRAVDTDGEVVAGGLPGGRTARLVHAGSFDGLGSAWQRLGAWIAGQGLTPGDTFWEVYLTEPTPEMDPADLRTELNWPVT